MIDNKKRLCEHGGLHPMIAIKCKYIPDNVYNHTKETFIKDWKSKSLLGLYSSEDISNFNNYEILENNIRCEIFIRELWHDMSKTILSYRYNYIS